jgi:hypothetical protein
MPVSTVFQFGQWSYQRVTHVFLYLQAPDAQQVGLVRAVPQALCGEEGYISAEGTFL